MKALLGAAIISGVVLVGCGKGNQAQAPASPTAQASTPAVSSSGTNTSSDQSATPTAHSWARGEGVSVVRPNLIRTLKVDPFESSKNMLLYSFAPAKSGALSLMLACINKEVKFMWRYAETEDNHDLPVTMELMFKLDEQPTFNEEWKLEKPYPSISPDGQNVDFLNKMLGKKKLAVKSLADDSRYGVFDISGFDEAYAEVKEMCMAHKPPANSQSPVTETRPTEKLPKLSSMKLFFSYQTDPFAFREKMVGKSIETSIFVTAFADDGNTARLIDGNTHFYCRLSGSDFSSFRKSMTDNRASAVVTGTLSVGSPGSEEIGLNNCKVIAVDDNTWKATDD